MKKIFFAMSLSFVFCFAVPGQIFSQDVEPVKTEVVAVDTITVKQVADEVLKVLTKNQGAEIIIPDSPVTPANPAEIFEWWVFIYGLLMPIGFWILSKVWPSNNKKELTIKAVSIAVVVVLIIVMAKGFTTAQIMNAVVALIFQAFTYDKVMQPLGMESAKKPGYKK